MAENFCPECGASNSEDAKHCLKCGCPFVEETTVYSSSKCCPECKFENSSESQVCSNCGFPFEATDKKKKKFHFLISKKVIAIVSVALLICGCFSLINAYGRKQLKEQLISGTWYNQESDSNINFREDNTMVLFKIDIFNDSYIATTHYKVISKNKIRINGKKIEVSFEEDAIYFSSSIKPILEEAALENEEV